MNIVNGYATYRIYEISEAVVAGEKQEVVGGMIDEVVGKEAAYSRLKEITASGKKAKLQYLCGVEDPTALNRRKH